MTFYRTYMRLNVLNALTRQLASQVPDDLQDRQRFYVYVVRDVDDRVLYVGQTTDTGARFYHHYVTSEWMDLAATVRIEAVVHSRDEARDIEADLIRRYRAAFNKHRPKRTAERRSARGEARAATAITKALEPAMRAMRAS